MRMRDDLTDREDVGGVDHSCPSDISKPDVQRTPEVKITHLRTGCND